MQKDLAYIAHHLKRWPSDATDVHLDSDGEICFDLWRHDFYPEGIHHPHPAYIEAQAYTYVEWEAARLSLRIPPAQEGLVDMLDAMSRSDALPDRAMVNTYIQQYARQCVMDLRQAITDEGGLYLFRSDDGYPNVTTASRLKDYMQANDREEAVILSGAVRIG